MSVNFRMNLWSHRFFQNMNKKLLRFLPSLPTQSRNPEIFCSYLGRNDDFINSLWNLLTFRCLKFRNVYFALPRRSCENINFPAHTKMLKWHSPDKNLALPQVWEANYYGFLFTTHAKQSIQVSKSETPLSTFTWRKHWSKGFCSFECPFPRVSLFEIEMWKKNVHFDLPSSWSH